MLIVDRIEKYCNFLKVTKYIHIHENTTYLQSCCFLSKVIKETVADIVWIQNMVTLPPTPGEDGW